MIRGEDVRSPTLAVADRRTADDVILVSSSARYGFSYYWPHGHVVFHSDTSGQGFWPEVSGLGAIYARGRTNDDVLAALRTAVERWHAAPAGSRLLIVRTHVSLGRARRLACRFRQVRLEAAPRELRAATSCSWSRRAGGDFHRGAVAL